MSTAGGWGYRDRDLERWVPESGKNSHRTEFERDRARILHSSALRRLGAKTQVVAPGSDDFVRTRLTHSLEVAQVGRELAGVLGCDRDVVDAACLSHDLGHPPFGHNGETALNEIAADIGGFEGNAQTLRLLTRLEPKHARPDGSPAGLNLTRASLDASCKYPWTLDGAPTIHGKATRKFGAYPDDVAVFTWLREGAPEHRACLEAQVMDLSDDVAYSVHDVEDAVAAGRIDLSTLADPEVQERVAHFTRQWYLPHTDPENILRALRHLQGLPYWAGDVRYVGDGARGGLNRRDLARLKDMTSQLIGRFCLSSLAATLGEYGHGPLVRFGAELVVPDHTVLEIAVLKGITTTFVMASENLQPHYERQRRVLRELVDAIHSDAVNLLEPAFAHDWREAHADAARLRIVVDQVASLTDVSALALHRALVGSTPREG